MATPELAPEDKRYRLYDGRVGSYEDALREILAHWKEKKAEAEGKIDFAVKELKRLGVLVPED